MTCDECRQQLVLAEESGAVSAPAREHLDRCSACQEFVRDGERLRTQMRMLAESEHAPRELREQVETLLSGGMPVKDRRRLWAGVAAATVLLAGWQALTGSDPDTWPPRPEDLAAASLEH